MTSVKSLDVEVWVLLSQEIPSDEEKMLAFLPTVTKVLFTNLTFLSSLEMLALLLFQEIPSVEVRIISSPAFPPTATKVLFPKATPVSEIVVPEVLLSQEIPSDDEGYPVLRVPINGL